MDVPITPDNAKVYRLMKNFKEFAMHASEMSSSSNSRFSSIPFPALNENDSSESSNKKRKFDISESALQKAQTAQLKHQHASKEQAYQKANHDLEVQNQKLILQNYELKERIDNQEMQIQRLTEQAITATDEILEIKREKNSNHDELEDLVMELQRKNEENMEEFEEEKRDKDARIKFLSNTNEELMSTVKSDKLALEESKAQQDLMEERLKRMTQSIENYTELTVKLQTEEQRVKELENRLSQAEDAEELSKALKSEMNKLRNLEQENSTLKKTNHNLNSNRENHQLTKEQLLSAEAKIERLENRLQEYERFEQKCYNLETQLKEFEMLKTEVDKKQNIELTVNDLQMKEAKLSIEKGELHTELISLKSKMKILEKKLISTETKLTEKEKQVKSSESLLRRLKSRAVLLAKERDSIRNILLSYDSDITSTTHTSQLMQRIEEVESINNQLHNQVEELNKELEKITRSNMNQNQILTKLESKEPSEASKPSSEKQASEIAKLKKLLDESIITSENLKKEVNRLELLIEESSLKGNYNPAKEKILHYQMNPFTLKHEEVKQELSLLKDENEKLKNKIMRLQENTQNLDISKVDVGAISSKEADELKDEVNKGLLMNKRLKEIFNKKIQELRQACYTLTGYRIDCTSESVYKLASMYAEQETDHLLFKSNSAGGMDLLDTEYSRSLKDLVDVHLKHQNSIPMFLSSLTNDLFSQQTMT